MSVVATEGLRELAAHVGSVLDPVFAVLDEGSTRVARFLGRAGVTAADLDPAVETWARPVLLDDGLVTGAGFVAAPGLLPDAPWHLAWWLRTDSTDGGGSARLHAVTDPGSEQFRDHTTLEWWRVPARTGLRHLTGPYVDYVCTEDYTITITVPLLRAGELLGMVGVDLLVDRLDTEVRPLLLATDVPTAIVNTSGRIVSASDVRREPGSILRLGGLTEALAPLRGASPVAVRLPGGAEVLPCGSTSLALVAGLSSR